MTVDKRPDIVFLVLDTQRADRLSCYGHGQEISPTLDNLAAESILFGQAVSPAQWTMPSHASMFTGLYPTQHQVTQMHSVLTLELMTLAERLQQVGYYTAGFSHNPLIGTVKNGLDRGFHQFLNYNYLGAGLLTARLNEGRGQSGTAAWLRQKSRFLLAELLGYSRLTSAHRLSPLLLPFWQLALRWRGKSKIDYAWESLEAAAQLLVKRTNCRSEQPIFTFINLMGTHVPYAPASWAVRRFLPGGLQGRSTNSWLQWSNSVQVDVDNWLAMTFSAEEEKAILAAFYNAEVATQDALVGQFINLLRNSGILDRAWFIIVADHGDHLGEKERLNHVFGLYEPLIHVPLLIRPPGGMKGRGQEVATAISTRRLFHTAVTAAGAATSAEESLSLLNESAEDVFAEGYPLEWATGRINQRRPGLISRCGYDAPVRALYANSRKLILTGDRVELYDLQSDHREERNLAAQEPVISENMQLSLRQFICTIRPIGESGIYIEEDTAVLEQLRSLGYLE